MKDVDLHYHEMRMRAKNEFFFVSLFNENGFVSVSVAFLLDLFPIGGNYLTRAVHIVTFGFSKPL